MMQVLEDFYIKCNKCNNIILVTTDSLDCSTSTYERAMGEEIVYDFQGEILCETCSSRINVNISGHEYPVGIFNFSNCQCCWGEFVIKPTLEIMYDFDDSCNDYAYDQYIKADDLLEYYKEQIKNMSPREFEFFVGDIFKKLGFNVKITQETRDGGWDIIATKSTPIPFTLIVECKHWRDRKVDVNVVRRVYGVQVANRANQSVVVTSSKFTRDARKFAEECENLMALVDMNDLLELVIHDYS